MLALDTTLGIKYLVCKLKLARPLMCLILPLRPLACEKDFSKVAAALKDTSDLCVLSLSFQKIPLYFD